MAEQNEAPKKKRGGGRPWTEAEKQARRELNARKRAEREAKEKADLEAYAAAQKALKKTPKKKLREGRDGPWSPEMRASNAATWAKKRAQKDAERKALIAENPHKTKRELGIPDHWKPADGSDDGYYARALRQARVGIDLPLININNPQEVAERIEQYFDFCESADRPPNLIGLGNWLGVSRDTIYNWKNGDFRGGTSASVMQKAVNIIEESLVNQVQANPKAMVGGIFLLKSMFHYREQSDVVIQTQDENRKKMSDSEIEQWFMTDGKTVETTFADEEQK